MQAIYGHGSVQEKKLYLRRQLERITTKCFGKTVGPIKRAKTAQVGAQGQLQTMVPQFGVFFVFAFFKKKNLQKYIFGFKFYSSIPLPPGRGAAGGLPPGRWAVGTYM